MRWSDSGTWLMTIPNGSMVHTSRRGCRTTRNIGPKSSSALHLVIDWAAGGPMNDYLEWAIKGIEREIEETTGRLEMLHQKVLEMRTQHDAPAHVTVAAREHLSEAPSVQPPPRRGRPPKNR